LGTRRGARERPHGFQGHPARTRVVGERSRPCPCCPQGGGHGLASAPSAGRPAVIARGAHAAGGESPPRARAGPAGQRRRGGGFDAAQARQYGGLCFCLFSLSASVAWPRQGKTSASWATGASFPCVGLPQERMAPSLLRRRGERSGGASQRLSSMWLIVLGCRAAKKRHPLPAVAGVRLGSSNSGLSVACDARLMYWASSRRRLRSAVSVIDYWAA